MEEHDIQGKARKAKKGRKSHKRGSYRKDFPQLFFEKCCEGKFPATIAHELGVLETQLITWSKSPRHRDFMTAWEKGRLACQAFHEQLYNDMIQNKIQVAATAITSQRDLLKTKFTEAWADKPQHIKIESTYEKMSDEDLVGQLEKLIAKSDSRHLMEDILKKTASGFKLINGGKDG